MKIVPGKEVPQNDSTQVAERNSQISKEMQL